MKIYLILHVIYSVPNNVMYNTMYNNTVPIKME